MKFLQKNKYSKTILVISDIHLGAGTVVQGRRNFLEDFHNDQEMAEFLKYFSSGDYASREVELIINGDFFDLLAVPFVPFYDDEYWSEEAALEKLKLIVEAHPVVIESMVKFLEVKKKKIVFIIGNHDGECVLDSLKEYILSLFPEKYRDNFIIHKEPEGEYGPAEGVLVKHGHEYELAHQFDQKKSIIVDESGKKYFLPPWGSYYVTRIINKFKEERNHINQVRPIKHFIIRGLIYDTLFTLRFAFANLYYFFMIRFISYVKQKKTFNEILEYIKKELIFFQDPEDHVREFFQKRPDIDVLILGHSHEAAFKTFPDGSIMINTGTWTRLNRLDLGGGNQNLNLTFAQIDIKEGPKKEWFKGKRSLNQDSFLSRFNIALNTWKGRKHLPYEEF